MRTPDHADTPSLSDARLAAWEAPPMPPDSIRAPKHNDRARIESERWRPVPITELPLSSPPDWVWPGYVARGYATLLVGLWKAGKSTLLGHVLRDAEHGGGLVPDPIDGPVLVVSEEANGHWMTRRDKLKLGESLRLITRPFKARPSAGEWGRFVEHVALVVKAEGYGMVVFDTLASLWPVVDENDAPGVQAALMPLHAITEARAGLVLVHHARKGGGDEAQATRGSGALPGWVDTIVELRRFAAEDAHDRRRVLRAYGRFEDTPPESVLELRDDGYHVIGDKATATRADRDATIRVLLAGAAGLTGEDVHGRWPTEPKPGKRALEKSLNDGAEAVPPRWGRAGKGVKGDPYRYSLGFDSRTTHSLGARIESALPSGRFDGEPDWGLVVPSAKPQRTD